MRVTGLTTQSSGTSAYSGCHDMLFRLTLNMHIILAGHAFNAGADSGAVVTATFESFQTVFYRLLHS